jgi:hypothetical protein
MNKVHPNSIFKKLLVLVLFFVFAGMSFAIEITLIPPRFEETGSLAGAIKDLNDDFKNAFDGLHDSLMDLVGGIEGNPKELIGAFGNASVFSSDGATQRGYRGYNLFAVTVGPMVGLQLPVSLFKIADELGNLDNLSTKLQEERDIKLGLDAQVLNAQVGLNTGFLVKNLYLGLKFGRMNLDIEGFTFKTSSFGVLANYQFMSKRNLAGILLWRGVNFGTGFIYQKTDFGYEMEWDPMTETVKFQGEPITTELTPKIKLGLSMSTVTVPLEAVTSVRLLYFLNAAFGFGIDLGFGSSKLEAVAATNFRFQGLEGLGLNQTQDASASVTMGGDSKPRFFNPKFITGLGFGLGPAVIDIPVTFYIGSGYNVGFTVGVAW